MLKNAELIKNNYFGLNIKDQRRLFEMLFNEIENLKEKKIDTSYFANFPYIFEGHLENKEELYKIKDAGLSLNKRSSDIFFDKNKREFLDYVIFEKYKGDVAFTSSKLFNVYNLSYNKLFFEFTKVESSDLDTFIKTFKRNANIKEKISFIEEFYDNYEILGKISYDLPEESLIKDDFDDLVKYIFGKPALLWYKTLLPHQKIDFIRKFGYKIIKYYESTTNLQEDIPTQIEPQKEEKKNNKYSLRYVNKGRKTRR